MLGRIVQIWGVFAYWMDRLAVVMTVVLVTSFTLVVLLQIFMRYVMGSALPWPDEFARFALVWMTFIAGSCALRRGQHVGIDYFVNKIGSLRVKALLKLVAVTVLIVLLCVMIWYSWQIAQSAARRTTPALGISYFWFHAGYFGGVSLILVQAIEHGLRALHAVVAPDEVSEADAAAISTSDM